MNKVKNSVIEVLNELGIETGDIGENDADLTEFITESIMFISFIVELEDKLEIEIPEELLNVNSIKSFNSFSAILEEFLNNKRL